MVNWLQGDPVNGILMTLAFFTFLIIGRNLRLWQLNKKLQAGQPKQETDHHNHDHAINSREGLGISPLHRLDARVKLICTVAAAFGSVALSHAEYGLIPIVACAVLAVYSRASLKGYFKRLMYPAYIAIVVLIVQMFTFGTHVVGNAPLLGWSIYQEGVASGILILARVLAATSALNLLITVTPMETLLDSLAWFRVPSVILDTTMLMWRYISVVSEERSRIVKAQQSRCGYTKSVGAFRKLANYGTVGGMLLVKSFDRAIKVGNAMISRGYTGTSSLFSYSTQKIENKDKIICGIVILAVIALMLFDLNII